MIRTLSILKSTYARFRNERAFTLVEMLFAFSIFTLIVFFISPIFQVMLEEDRLHGRLQELEWEVFCSQMKKEIRMSTKVQATGSSLILTEDAGTVVYEKYQNSLRRRVYMTGHEVLLQNIADANFTLQEKSINVEVTDLDGNEYQIVVYSFVNWSGIQ